MSRANAPSSILVVRAEPGDRPIDRRWDIVTEALRRRGDVGVATWYLRRSADAEPAPGDRVVDDLRSDPAAQRFERPGLAVIAGLLRGRRLRRWYREVAPEVVVLDDGLGARIIARGARRPVLVDLRDEVPRSLPTGERRTEHVDLVILHGRDAVLPDGVDTLVLPPFGNHRDAVTLADPAHRDAVRAAYGLPAGVPLVVSWPAVGGEQGPEHLWTLLEAGRGGDGGRGAGGRPVEALWLDPAIEPVRARELRDATAQRGLADRFHIRAAVTAEAAMCADVALVDPSVAVGDELVPLLASGMVARHPDDSAPLRASELSAAARARRSSAYLAELAVDSWCDRLVEAISRVGNGAATRRG